MNNPIIENEALPVNAESDFSGNFDNEITIHRCPHDEENPYTMVRNELVRDMSISPECRWLIIYLLSNKAGWKINVQQVINHLQPHMGRNAVYRIFDEAIKAGYMKREDIKKSFGKKGSIKSGIKYFVSEIPKFKESLRRPENRDTDDRDPENRELKNKHASKKDYPKESNSSLKVPAEENAAKAAEMESNPSPKSKREKPDFSPKVREVGNQMINSLTRTKPDYLPPKNLSAFLTEVDFVLRLDKRDPEKLIDVFNWALSDSFWADKMFKPNPAKYLREKFDQLEMKMMARPMEVKKDRKFAPSSNDDKALEKMKEMSSRAI